MSLSRAIVSSASIALSVSQASALCHEADFTGSFGGNIWQAVLNNTIACPLQLESGPGLFAFTIRVAGSCTVAPGFQLTTAPTGLLLREELFSCHVHGSIQYTVQSLGQYLPYYASVSLWLSKDGSRLSGNQLSNNGALFPFELVLTNP
jgi:hypothetical protein